MGNGNKKGVYCYTPFWGFVSDLRPKNQIRFTHFSISEPYKYMEYNEAIQHLEAGLVLVDRLKDIRLCVCRPSALAKKTGMKIYNDDVKQWFAAAVIFAEPKPIQVIVNEITFREMLSEYQLLVAPLELQKSTEIAYKQTVLGLPTVMDNLN